MKSIIQKEKECYICRLEATRRGYMGNLTDRWLHEHHIFYGSANRPKSEQHGLKVYLCETHHEDHKEGVHHNKPLDLSLKGIAQRKFEEVHTREEFRKEFGKSWL